MPVDCTRCSTRLPDEAPFCWRCGHVRRTMTTGADGAVAYESCEIVYARAGRSGEMVFRADAVGDSGPYTAAQSEPLKYETLTYLGGDSPIVLDRLMAALTVQGWESLGVSGSYYWDHRLRRRTGEKAQAANGASGSSV
jgi:hypothetical protein